MANPRRIKCRFCDATFPVFFRERGGRKSRSGFELLEMHVEDAHHEEWRAIMLRTRGSVPKR